MSDLGFVIRVRNMSELQTTSAVCENTHF